MEIQRLDNITIDQMHYGTETAKGNGLTQYGVRSRSGSDVEEPNFPRIRKRLLEERDNPEGFLLFKNADQDYNLSEDFAEAEIRCSRATGLLVLDQKAFKEWASLVEKETQQVYPASEIVDYFTTDKPAILSRLTGPRYEDLFYDIPDGFYSAQNIIKHVAEGHIAEMTQNLQAYENRYGLAVKPFLPQLIKLSQGEITAETLDTFFTLESYLMGYNAGRMGVLSNKKYQGRLAIRLLTTSEQDLGVGAMINDLSMAFVPPKFAQTATEENLTEDLELYFKEAFKDLFEFLTKKYAVNELNRETYRHSLQQGIHFGFNK